MATGRSGSLVRLTKVLRVEPFCIVDKTLRQHPDIVPTMKVLNTLFAAYFSQGFQLIQNVGRIDVVGTLDQLNPNRDLGSNASKFVGKQVTEYVLDRQSYRDGLPRPGMNPDTAQRSGYVFNAEDDERPVEGNNVVDARKSIMDDMVNLSVGKMLDIEFNDGEHKAVFTLAIRLLASSIQRDLMVSTLALGAKDNSLKERWYLYRDGSISMRELLTMKDLIAEHRNNLINDQSGFYSAVVSRRNKNTWSAILSGKPSLAEASTIAILDGNTAKMLEIKVGGKLDNFALRQRIFEETSLMLMAVIDQDYDMLTIYHDSIAEPTELSMSAVRTASKNNNVDVLKMLQAFKQGLSPVF